MCQLGLVVLEGFAEDGTQNTLTEAQIYAERIGQISHRGHVFLAENLMSLTENLTKLQKVICGICVEI